MKLAIRHRVTYSYGTDVYLEPHTLRFWPRLGPSIRLIDLDISVKPAPSVRAENLDVEGNSVLQVWFDRVTASLTIESRVEVETLATDPFGFLADEPDAKLPYVYTPGSAPTLAPYRVPPERIPEPVRQLALAVAEEAHRDQLEFPLMLVRAFRRDFAYAAREFGEPNPSEVTASTRAGACRDLAVLFVDCCRAMGLAARFVSGYAYMPDAPQADLHAWGEVYLPGGGWRGYDPSYGIAVTDHHVVLAAAAESADAALVTGTFRGSASAASLVTTLSVTADCA